MYLKLEPDHVSEKLAQYYANATRNVQFNGCHDEVYYALHYVFSMKGKKLRPILLLHANQLFNGNMEEALPAALAMELFHNFTLVHDDIMDQASIRRGMPTVHIKYGLGTAINTGDLLMIVAYKYISQVRNEYFREALSMYNHISTRIMEGQCLDLDYENREIISSEAYLNMIELKTSLLIAFCMKLGALLGGASTDDQELMFQLGRNIGLSFQLKDDWLDTYGDERTGKRIGGDIVQNKKTYLYIKAWEGADQKQRQRLKELKSIDDHQQKVKKTIEIYDTLGIGSITERLIEKYYTSGLECLRVLNIPENKKKPMFDLIQRIHNRNY